MAYNNGFPMNYQQQYMYPQQQQPYQQPMQPAPQATPQMSQNPSMIWVQGEAGAKAFPLTPGNTISLWDSENPTIYIKSSDASGIPSMKVIDYVVREQGEPRKNSLTEKQPEIDLSGFVTYEELDNRLKALTNKIENLANRQQKPQQKEYSRKERNNNAQ